VEAAVTGKTAIVAFAGNVAGSVVLMSVNAADTDLSTAATKALLAPCQLVLPPADGPPVQAMQMKSERQMSKANEKWKTNHPSRPLFSFLIFLPLLISNFSFLISFPSSHFSLFTSSLLICQDTSKPRLISSEPDLISSEVCPDTSEVCQDTSELQS
jgi:hypothetical protein